jgi:GT2 family glycosyltransferase
MSLVLQQPMDPGPPPQWPGSVWVGSLELSADLPERIPLTRSAGYRQARLLLRRGRWPCGFVQVEAGDGTVSAGELLRRAAELPDIAWGGRPVTPLPVSIVLCTRDRPEALRCAVASLLALDYPSFEIVVVDNASSTRAAADVVTAAADPRVRLLTEPRPGLARARNVGLSAARHEIVAFTDDDVVVDRSWLWGLMDGFAAGSDVECVCGMVASGEIRSFPQAYFDARVTWARRCSPQIYSLAAPPPHQPLFPFQIGQFGTGANFAVRRRFAVDLGGFDEALGAGARTKSGEDVDLFVRVLLAGRTLVYQPSALVWHRHRADVESLLSQMTGYAIGLGAWVTKLLCDRRTVPMVLRRVWKGLHHARSMTRVEVAPGWDLPEVDGGGRLRSAELWAFARGPGAYALARLAGARKAPLTNRPRVAATVCPTEAGVAG